jgi:sec-independent protein translocase protein TatA
MMGLGWQELTIILIIIVIIFGAGKLPEVGNALGRGIKEFKSQAGGEDELASSTTTSTGTTATTASTTARAEEPVVVEKREMRPDEI